MMNTEGSMGEVVKLDRKAREARRKAEAAKANGATAKAPGGGRAVAAVIGGLILVLMIVVTFVL
jgi:hypothetical protein